MINLARRAEAGPAPLRLIADCEGLAVKYLESIASLLLRQGLLKSTRGKDGGYSLARPAAEYNVFEILTAAEGDMSPVHCMEDASDRCPLSTNCPTLPVWEGLAQVVRGYLENVRLSDLLDDAADA